VKIALVLESAGGGELLREALRWGKVTGVEPTGLWTWRKVVSALRYGVRESAVIGPLDSIANRNICVANAIGEPGVAVPVVSDGDISCRLGAGIWAITSRKG
jgi:hypothetical protein